MSKQTGRKLSIRETKFVDALARGLSGVDACLEAGYSANPKTRSVTASRLRKKPHIQARLAEIIQPTQPLDEREKHIARLESMRDECRAAKSYAAAVRCEELISKARWRCHPLKSRGASVWTDRFPIINVMRLLLAPLF